MTRRLHRSRDERGAALILVAILMVTMLTVAALVIDGGFGYPSHRQMQNAADSSALAGTRALQLARFNNGSTALIASEALLQAQKNGADTSQFECRAMTLAESQMDPIPTPSTLCSGVNNGNKNTFVGVWVRTGETHSNILGGFTGASTQRTRGLAAATVQRAVGGAGPWMICGTAAGGGWDFINGGVIRSDAELAARYGVHQDWPTIIPAGGHGSGLSNINGTWAMDIHGAQTSNKDCGIQGSSWKGLIDPADLPLQAFPQVVHSDNGNQVGHYKYTDVLARTDGCPSQAGSGTPSEGTTFDNCLVLIPIFDQVIPGGSSENDKTRLVDVAVFRVFYSQTGNNKYYAQFVCRETCTLKSGPSTSNLNSSGIPVVKLVL